MLEQRLRVNDVRLGANVERGLCGPLRGDGEVCGKREADTHGPLRGDGEVCGKREADTCGPLRGDGEVCGKREEMTRTGHFVVTVR